VAYDYSALMNQMTAQRQEMAQWRAVEIQYQEWINAQQEQQFMAPYLAQSSIYDQSPVGDVAATPEEYLSQKAHDEWVEGLKANEEKVCDPRPVPLSGILHFLPRIRGEIDGWCGGILAT